MELTKITTYQDLKKALDQELYQEAAGFVRIGYLIKKARDTNIIAEAGYENVFEFAAAEYDGMDKSTVSRFIAINDRYSKDGYSPELAERYEGYGRAKLAEMLTLPDEIIETIPKEATRAEIQNLKREIREEEEKTPMEVMMEPRKHEGETQLGRLIICLFEKDTYWKEFEELYNFIKEKPVHGLKESREAVISSCAPSGYSILYSRVPGEGKYMISLNEEKDLIDIINTRSNEKFQTAYSDIISEMRRLFGCDGDYKESWETFYGISMEQVAPVQPKEQVSENTGKHLEEKKEEKTARPEKNKALEPVNDQKNDSREVVNTENEPEEPQKEQPKMPENSRNTSDETISGGKEPENVTEQSEIVQEEPENVDFPSDEHVSKKVVKEWECTLANLTETRSRVIAFLVDTDNIEGKTLKITITEV